MIIGAGMTTMEYGNDTRREKLKTLAGARGKEISPTLFRVRDLDVSGVPLCIEHMREIGPGASRVMLKCGIFEDGIFIVAHEQLVHESIQCAPCVQELNEVVSSSRFAESHGQIAHHPVNGRCEKIGDVECQALTFFRQNPEPLKRRKKSSDGESMRESQGDAEAGCLEESAVSEGDTWDAVSAKRRIGHGFMPPQVFVAGIFNFV